VSLRDGALDDPAVEMHVRECGLCQARLAEARMMRHAFRSSQARPVGEHLSDKDVGQYFDAVYLGEPMRTTRLREIASHLDSCAACLRRLLELRVRLMPSASLRERLFGQFRQLERGGGQGKYKLVVSELMNRLAMTLLGGPEETHLGAAARGLARLDRMPDMPGPALFQDIARWLEPAASETSEPRFESEKARQQLGPLRAREHLTWASANVDLECVVEGQRKSLTVTLTDRTSGRANSGVTVSLVTGTDTRQKAKTDADGVAAFALPEGKSILSIGIEPPLEIEMDFQRPNLP
jgi:hypothetical protein